MIHTAAAAAALATLALATLVPVGTVSAQTFGQPVYLNAYGRTVGGTPLSEVEMRSYGETGRWADGYSDRPRVFVPAPEYGRRDAYGHPGYGHSVYGQDRASGYRRHDPGSQPGYRDEWGYSDDRPPPARRGSDGRPTWHFDRDCGCGDLYLYDR